MNFTTIIGLLIRRLISGTNTKFCLVLVCLTDLQTLNADRKTSISGTPFSNIRAARPIQILVFFADSERSQSAEGHRDGQRRAHFVDIQKLPARLSLVCSETV